MKILSSTRFGWYDFGAGSVRILKWIAKAFAAKGHHFRVVTLGPHKRGHSEVTRDQSLSRSKAQNVLVEVDYKPGVDRFFDNGVEFIRGRGSFEDRRGDRGTLPDIQFRFLGCSDP